MVQMNGSARPSDPDPDPCRLSLEQKKRLFSQLSIGSSLDAAKTDPSLGRTGNVFQRTFSSRFVRSSGGPTDLNKSKAPTIGTTSSSLSASSVSSSNSNSSSGQDSGSETGCSPTPNDSTGRTFAGATQADVIVNSSAMEVDDELKQLKNGSLAERLRALEQTQQNWRQRLNKSPEPSTSISARAAKRLSIDSSTNIDSPHNRSNHYGNHLHLPSSRQQTNSAAGSIRLRERPKSICIEPSIVSGSGSKSSAGNGSTITSRLADRLSLLQQSSRAWVNRVEEKDVKRFTVAGRLELTDRHNRPPQSSSSALPSSAISSSSSCSESSSSSSSSSDKRQSTKFGHISIDASTTMKDPMMTAASTRHRSPSEKENLNSYLKWTNQSIDESPIENKQKRIRPMSDLISHAWEVDQAKNRRSWTSNVTGSASAASATTDSSSSYDVNRYSMAKNSYQLQPKDSNRSTYDATASDQHSQVSQTIRSSGDNDEADEPKDRDEKKRQNRTSFSLKDSDFNRIRSNDEKFDSNLDFDLPTNRQTLLVIRKSVPTQNRRAASKRFVKSLANNCPDGYDANNSGDCKDGITSIAFSSGQCENHQKIDSCDKEFETPLTRSTLRQPRSISISTSDHCASFSTTNHAAAKDVHSGLAESARAGLASTEDFKSVASRLRKATPNTAQHLNHSDLRKQPLIAGLRSASRGSRSDAEQYDRARSATRFGLSHIESNLDCSSDEPESPGESDRPVLLQVKGRRHTQIRNVPAEPESMNHGDCFVLITRDIVFAWLGEFANVIERAKAIELAERLHERRELGHRGGRLIGIDMQTSDGVSASTLSSFANALNVDGGLVQLDARIRPAGDADEDERYERQVRQQDQIFRVDFEPEQLRPDASMNVGKPLSQRWLHSNQAFVFDMVDEVYVWLGSRLSADQRTVALRLARQQFAQQARRSHALFHKCNQHMELQLFCEKFSDWSHVRVPDLSAQLAASGCIGGLAGGHSAGASINHASIGNQNNTAAVSMMSVRFDVKNMLNCAKDPDLVLEDTHLGRGDAYHDEAELLHSRIVTQQVRCWHVNESERREVPTTGDARFGQFFDTETYVLRWQYVVSRIGRELDLAKRYPFARPATTENTTESKRSATLNVDKSDTGNDRSVLTGRERCCYFYWQGSRCSVNSRGAAALLAIELDKEKSPQVQIDQGRELPAFLRLFAGQLVIYHSEPGEAMPHSERAHSNSLRPRRLFAVRGVMNDEATLVEVPRAVRSLRSRGCFLLLDANRQHVLLWKGAETNQQQQEVAQHAFQAAIEQHRFHELSHRSATRLTGSECSEGDEPSSFWSFFDQSTSDNLEESTAVNPLRSDADHIFDGQDYRRRAYCSVRLVGSAANRAANHEMRLFQLTSASGEFQFEPILCPYSKADRINPFPFEQSQLYSVSQPAFFLLDAGPACVYLWQGWFPELVGSLVTGSSKVRYSQEKKCALETVVSYTHQINATKPPKACLVYAGLEPAEFIALFPSWQVHQEARSSQLADGKHVGEVAAVQEVLARVCNVDNLYSLEDLRKRPLPDGINPLCIETYLTDREFKSVLGTNRDEFYRLPSWKQYNLKQKGGLF